MAVFQQDIYKELSNDILKGDNKEANAFVLNVIKTTIPKNDFNPEFFKKTLYTLPLTVSKKQPVNCNKKKHISRKEKLRLGLLHCPKEGWKYEEFEQLRQLWIKYIKHFLRINKNDVLPSIESVQFAKMSQMLYKADYHGAQMKVIRSKCPSIVGVEGTCILDTKNTFRILSKDNKCRIIPKQDSLFEIQIENFTITVFGKYIQSRPAERSTKKRKNQIIFDL